MKKIMKKYTASSAKSIGLVVIGFACAVGTIALAYTAPTAAPTGGNVPAPVNTGTVAQTKSGDLTIGLLGSNTKLISNSWILGINAIIKNIVSSARGSFTDKADIAGLYALSRTDYLQAGEIDASTAGVTKGLTVDKNGKTLVIGNDDISTVAPMVKIENTGANTKLMNLFQVKSNQGGLSVFSRGGLSTFTDAAASVTQVNGNLSVDKELYLHGGNPAAGKVLISKDAGGTAAWGNVQKDYIAYSVYSNRAQGTGSVTVSCNSGDFVIGGGGDCEYGIRTSQPSTGSSIHGNGNNFNATNSWSVSCLTRNDAGGHVVGNGGTAGAAHAEVICMKNIQPITDIAATTSGANTGTGTGTGTGGGSSPTPDWHPAPLVTGDTNGTCADYMAKVNLVSGINATQIRSDDPIGKIAGCAIKYQRAVSYQVGGTTYTGTCLTKGQTVTANNTQATYNVVSSCTSSLGTVTTELFY